MLLLHSFCQCHIVSNNNKYFLRHYIRHQGSTDKQMRQWPPDLSEPNMSRGESVFQSSVCQYFTWFVSLNIPTTLLEERVIMILVVQLGKLGACMGYILAYKTVYLLFLLLHFPTSCPKQNYIAYLYFVYTQVSALGTRTHHWLGLAYLQLTLRFWSL